MVRAPCCEKMGLKKGPWTPEEDQILINYIQLYGHGNWRALPKQAGLLRCGKSCRLRWINYLRPDLKRGNFTGEEEETIIQLHELLGNRWSVIAAKLPGRTDNEIKNVWHTHLKKRLKQDNNSAPQNKSRARSMSTSKLNQETEPETEKMTPISPQHSSSSDISSSVTSNGGDTINSINNIYSKFEPSLDGFPTPEESFWLEPDIQFQFSPLLESSMGSVYDWNSNFNDSMDFWYNLFVESGQVPEL